MASNQTPTSRLETSYSSTQDILIEMADLIGHKWHPVILHQLFAVGECGFSELHAAIDDISNKMLSDSLTTLEDNGLVERAVVNEKPVRVRYSLTNRGHELKPMLESMIDWGHEHLSNQQSPSVQSPPTAATATQSLGAFSTTDTSTWSRDDE